MPAQQVKIRIEGLTKVFGPHPQTALRLLREGVSKDEIYERTGQAVGLADVGFDVYQGEILVVMGLSGSGKSTLIRCVNRLIEPTAGKIVIDGRDIATLDEDDLREFRRHKLGMVFQNFALFPHRSVLQNVEYGLEVQGMEPERRAEKAREALALVGLEGWGEAMPAQLSGGMQQRVGLARALAIDPDILLMDEAFSALDPLIRRDMQHELVALQERVHKTILFISHDLDEAIRIGNRIVLMKDGAVVQVGTPEEILTSPASRYVERFVEDLDVSKVLTAASILTKARVVAYPDDGPRTALRKMEDENYSSILVVRRDYRLLGVLSAEQASEAVRRGAKTIESYIDTDIPSVQPDAPLSRLINIVADGITPLPVVDAGGRLRGVVVRGALLGALAKAGEAGLSEGGGELEGAA